MKTRLRTLLNKHFTGQTNFPFVRPWTWTLESARISIQEFVSLSTFAILQDWKSQRSRKIISPSKAVHRFLWWICNRGGLFGLVHGLYALTNVCTPRVVTISGFNMVIVFASHSVWNFCRSRRGCSRKAAVFIPFSTDTEQGSHLSADQEMTGRLSFRAIRKVLRGVKKLDEEGFLNRQRSNWGLYCPRGWRKSFRDHSFCLAATLQLTYLFRIFQITWAYDKYVTGQVQNPYIIPKFGFEYKLTWTMLQIPRNKWCYRLTCIRTRGETTNMSEGLHAWDR